MIIKQHNNEVEFGELKVGDVFRCNGLIYIKTNYYTTDSGYEFDAYDLETNDFCYFSNNSIIEKVKAVLNIE